MSEVKRFDMRGNTCLSEDGHLVSYQDYAEIKAERDVMAAENVALKELAKGYADLADSRLSDITANCESDCRRECYEECNKTPATDAYLNSVRAEGVDMFAAHHGTVADFANGDHQLSHRITEIRAKHFAAQLRAGEPS